MDFFTINSLPVALIAIIVSILLLVRAGNWTIDAAVHVASNLGMPPLMIGFTILAFGTSLPELVVSVFSHLEGSTGIALGNVIGSNIANLLMVLGLTSVFVTLQVHSKAINQDLIMMLLCTGLLAGLLFYGLISQGTGVLMMLGLVGYILWQYKMAKAGKIPVEEVEDSQYSSEIKAYGFLFLGLAGIALGAELLVRGAIFSAGSLGVPEAVIALSVVALGTSLPELTTCIIAARKGQNEIVLGNIIGSNVFNILMIVGATAIIKPILAGSFTEQLINFDIWILALVSIIFTLILVFVGRLTRLTGVLFLGAYIAYNVYIYWINMYV